MSSAPEAVSSTLCIAEAAVPFRMAAQSDDDDSDSSDSVVSALELEPLLLAACKDGLLDEVQRLVEAGATWDTRRRDTPFHAACKDGNLPVAQWLLQWVPETSTAFVGINEMGKTPFHLACGKGHLHVAQWLYASALDTRTRIVTQADAKGRTPFMEACRHGHIDVLRWLYLDVPEAFGTVIQPTTRGSTPFCSACSNGHLYVALWLYEHVIETRATITQGCNEGITAFSWACRRGHLEIVQWMCTSVPEAASTLCKADREGQTPFFSACKFRHLEVAQWMYEQDPCIRARVSTTALNGLSPFRYCLTTSDREEMAAWLATLPHVQPELLQLTEFTLDADIDTWDRWEPIVARAKIERVGQLLRLVRRQGQSFSRVQSTQLANVLHRDCEGDEHARKGRCYVLGRVARPVMLMAVSMLAPAEE